MSTRQITMNQLLDEAVDELPRFRRRVMKRRLRSKRYRNDVIEELQLKLHDCEECAALGVQAVFASNLNGDTPFEIDVNKLEQLLQLIVTFLPQIFEIVLGFLNNFSVILLAVTLAASATQSKAYAVSLNPLSRAEIIVDQELKKVSQQVLTAHIVQVRDCENGVCNLPQQAVQEVEVVQPIEMVSPVTESPQPAFQPAVPDPVVRAPVQRFEYYPPAVPHTSYSTAPVVTEAVFVHRVQPTHYQMQPVYQQPYGTTYGSGQVYASNQQRRGLFPRIRERIRSRRAARQFARQTRRSARFARFRSRGW